MEKSVKIYHSKVDRFRKNYLRFFVVICVLAFVAALLLPHKDRLGVSIIPGIMVLLFSLKYYGLFLHRYKIEGSIITYRHFYNVFYFDARSIVKIDNRYLARDDIRHGIYGSGSRKDMIRIVLRNGEGLHFSPADKKSFIEHLLAINPSIDNRINYTS